VAQHVCFALFVGRHGARSKVHGSVGARAPALGERAWVDAEDGVDDLDRETWVSTLNIVADLDRDVLLLQMA
jgi:hypothetical protein